MNVDERFNTMENHMAEFREMFGTMNAAIERLSREVTSLQFSSGQKEVEGPQQSRQEQAEQQPHRVSIHEVEAENNLDDMEELDEFEDEEDMYGPRDRRYERSYGKRDMRFDERKGFQRRDKRAYEGENRRFGDRFEDRYERDAYGEHNYDYRREPDRRGHVSRDDLDGDLGSIKMKIPYFHGTMNAEKYMNVDETFKTMEKNMAEFWEMFGTMTAARERLLREVTSLHFSSGQKEVGGPQ